MQSKIAVVATVFGWLAASAAQAGTITVTDNLTYPNMGGTTCTLSQAIAAANLANGVTPDSVGSGTTAVGFSYTGPLSPGANKLGNCTGATSGANSVVFAPALAGATLTYTTLDFQMTPWNSDSLDPDGLPYGWGYDPYNLADNYWYGLNALPPIASTISIDGGSAGITLKITFDTFPPGLGYRPRLRFFYVSGGLTGELPAGSLSLQNMTLTGGQARGGFGGGGGAGMGGAIFNQGIVNLTAVTLTSNSAIGGNSTPGPYAAGGMGDSAQEDGGAVWDRPLTEPSVTLTSWVRLTADKVARVLALADMPRVAVAASLPAVMVAMPRWECPARAAAWGASAAAPPVTQAAMAMVAQVALAALRRVATSAMADPAMGVVGVAVAPAAAAPAEAPAAASAVTVLATVASAAAAASPMALAASAVPTTGEEARAWAARSSIIAAA